jgi:hypothetical protein
MASPQGTMKYAGYALRLASDECGIKDYEESSAGEITKFWPEGS